MSALFLAHRIDELTFRHMCDVGKFGHPLSPARDLKFYTFYGEVGLVLEVSRYPVRENWWWSADGKPAETGKYEHAKSAGYGITPEQIEIAKNISLQIPAPFMRIDFLRGYDHLYLLYARRI